MEAVVVLEKLYNFLSCMQAKPMGMSLCFSWIQKKNPGVFIVKHCRKSSG